MYKCKFCEKKFEKPQQAGGHTVYCRKNPKYGKNCESNRKSQLGKHSFNNYVERITIKTICKKCKNEFEQIVKKNGKGYQRKFCSPFCANGHPHTKEWNENIRKNVKSKKWKTNYFKFLTERFNNPKLPGVPKRIFCIVCGIELFNTKGKYCKKCRDKHLREIFQTEKFRQKMRIANKKSYEIGHNYVAGGTTKWIEIETSNGKIKVQGSYEVRMVKILEYWKQNREIKNWKYSSDRFKYIGLDNKEHTYIIDFKIINNDNTFYYVETKGYEKEQDKLKWKSVRDKGYILKVLFKEDIKKIENGIWVC